MEIAETRTILFRRLILGFGINIPSKRHRPRLFCFTEPTTNASKPLRSDERLPDNVNCWAATEAHRFELPLDQPFRQVSRASKAGMLDCGSMPPTLLNLGNKEEIDPDLFREAPANVSKPQCRLPCGPNQ